MGHEAGSNAREPNQHFDPYTPIIAFPQMSGLCRAQICPRLSFEGLYYSYLLFWALQTPAPLHCPICTHIWSFFVPFLGLGQSWTMPSPCFDLRTYLPAFVL